MDKNNKINYHSKEKLEVYKKYLERYLSVMLNSPYDNIAIIEPFAGKGIASDGNKGSAVLAKEVLLNFSSDKNFNKIKLYLNDKDNYEDLNKNINPGSLPIEISNKPANDFIDGILNKTNYKTHRFFFIDPFGYTQISKDTYTKLFNARNVDILIFIPTYFIYRFLNGDDADPNYKPIADFLSYFDIDKNIAKKAKSDTEFAEEIRKCISIKTESAFVYKKQIRNEIYNSTYHLFFISKHIYGADKFIETIDRIEKDNPDLFFVSGIISDIDDILIKYIMNSNKLTNCQIYKIGIRLGFSSSRQQKILDNLEISNRILVQSIGTKKRRPGCFYTTYDNFNKQEERICIMPNTEKK